MPARRSAHKSVTAHRRDTSKLTAEPAEATEDRRPPRQKSGWLSLPAGRQVRRRVNLFKRERQMHGSINETDINEVRERNNIIEVISEYVTLKKAGRTYKGLCPFHKEKTPSFVVDPLKQLYHCFGCGEGGNVFTFIMKTDNLDFPEAVEALAKRIGYSLHYEKTGSPEIKSRQARLYEANSSAVEYYHQILLSEEKGKRAREYLKGRGYSRDIVETFKLGYALTEWDGLTKHLYKKGFKSEELERAGLSIRGEKGSYYDRFRDRVIFPIFDIKGQAVGFGGRVLDDSLPKYLNSPETPIYHKGSLLYNLSNAKGEIVKEGQALVVEGYTDVISLFSAGAKNVVATSGTAFTSDHLRLLARFTDKVVLVFDADLAGKSAAERGLELLGESRVDISVATLPEGLDPAEVVSEKGNDEFRRLIDRAVSLIDFCLSQAIMKHDLSKAQGRIRASEETLSVVAALSNKIAQEEALKTLAQKIAVSEDALRLEFKKLSSRPSRGRREPTAAERPRPEGERFSDDPATIAQSQREKEILKLILQHPVEFRNKQAELSEDLFVHPEHKRIFSFLKNQTGAAAAEPADMMTQISESGFQKMLSQFLVEPIQTTDQEKYFEDILRRMKEFKLQRQIDNLKKQLDHPELSKDERARFDLFGQLQKLEAKKRQLMLPPA